VNWLKYAYFAHFSKPRAERQLYRLIKRHKVCRIVEIGMGDVNRAAKLIRVAQRYANDGKVFYTGVDWFDARTDDMPELTLKQAHRYLQTTGAQVRLVPGDPGRSVASVANAHQHTGLLIISPAVTDSMLAPAWFYVPRMLDQASVVLRERTSEAGELSFDVLTTARIVELARPASGRRVA
jgi:hypothetical protein